VIRPIGLLAVVGACWLSLAGCGGDDSGAGLLAAEGGVLPGDDAGTTATTCKNSKDCLVDQVCDPTTKVCVQCASNADCMTGLECQASKCVMPMGPCTNSLDCKDPMSPICDGSTGKCVVCVASKDCPENNDCVDHACKPFTAVHQLARVPPGAGLRHGPHALRRVCGPATTVP